ncbi:cytochrome c oxidase assembly protein [Williamsia deligens]|uniref:Cytochrome c oxidase assembly protein n=1 Tax=Williamsia deligens TaxID=321325 RepID=A0ABW3GC12_9NOCA|nr:cytochrome c oxidase assembly protein [Williamsia deligens]MCP2195624.1 putative copper resistance protein D [Williamsia deligens]
MSTPPVDTIDLRRSAAGAVAWAVTWGAVAVAVIVTAVSASTAVELLGIPDPGWVTTYGIAAVQGIGEVAAALAVGSVLFAAFFVPPQRDGVLDVGGYRAMRWAAVSALVWAVASVLMIPLSLSNVSGLPLSETLSPGRWADALDQVADARSWLWTAVFAVLAAIVARVGLRWWTTLVALAIAVLSLMPLALGGHSSAGGDHDLATNSLILHIVGASVWMGGLFAVLAYARGLGGHTALAVQRFSRVALWCIVVVGVSGVINALIRVHLDELFTTTYGRVVLLKVLALVVLGALGAVHRRRTVTALSADPGDRGAFMRFALVELGVFAATFGLAVGLARTPPPARDTSSISVTAVELGYDLPGKPTLETIATFWRPDLILGLAAIVLGATYLRGVLRLRRRGDAWPVGRTVSFTLGAVLLLVTTSSGLGAYSPAMFSIHMIAHMLLSMLIPVLFVLGGPVTLALRALTPAGSASPPGPREWILAALHSPVSRFLTHPLVAFAQFVGSFYILYFSGLLDAVATYHAAHILMNIHFLVSGYLFYWVVIGIDPSPRAVQPLIKVAMVFAALPFHAFFGVILMSQDTVIARDWFGELRLPWNTDLLADQRVGGSIAWAAGEVPLVIVLIALFIQWTRHDQRVARRLDRRADRDDDAELTEYNAMLAGLATRGDGSRAPAPASSTTAGDDER